MKKIKSVKAQVFALLLLLGLTQPGFAALVDMAEYADWAGVEASISAEDINATQPDGMSALFWAVYHEEAAMVSLLLDAGADANVQNRYGLTPLIQASTTGNGEIISMLLDAGADANARTLQGDTALMNAAKAGTVQGVQALIDAGADVEARDGYGFQTPLMWAAAANQAEIVRMLAENGADVNAKSAELIFSGIQQGGVQGDFPNGGLTALHHAARDNGVETVAVLLELGADPNILDPQDISPLRVAATNENLDVAKILIEGGADLNDGSLVDIMEIPYKRFAFEHAASNYDNQATVEELTMMMIEMGADLNAMSETGIPVFSTGFVGEKGPEGESALFRAAAGDRPEDIVLLLEHGADVNALSAKGNTVLGAVLNVYTGYRAPDPTRDKRIEPTFEEKMPTVDLLFEYGADINAIVGTGGTILHQAAELGEDEVVEMLIARGVDLSIKDKSNRTALDVASGIEAIDKPEDRNPNMPVETPVYESTMAIITEAMNAQGIAIEEYVAPPSEEGEEGSSEA